MYIRYSQHKTLKFENFKNRAVFKKTLKIFINTKL